MSHEKLAASPPAFLLWILAIGGAGFAAGFFGPLALNPEANQGPLLGIFITGPGGVILGAILYVICRTTHVSAARQWTVMACAGVLLALATLFVCLPGPRLRGYVVDAQIVGCKAPAQLSDQAVQYWEQRVKAVTWAAPRSGWEADSRQRLEADPAVVLDVLVLRRNGIDESRKPWSAGSISTRGWFPANENKTYYAQFAGSACSDYPLQSKALLFVAYDPDVRPPTADNWPPRDLPAFLNLQSLTLVPPEYQAAAGN